MANLSLPECTLSFRFFGSRNSPIANATTAKSSSNCRANSDRSPTYSTPLLNRPANRGAIVWAGMPSSATAARINSSSTGRLRPIGFVQRHLDHRRLPWFRLLDAAIDASGLADRGQELSRRIGDRLPRDFQRPVDARQREPPRQRVVPCDEIVNGLVARVAADPVGDVEGEEVARFQRSRPRFSG